MPHHDCTLSATGSPLVVRVLLTQTVACGGLVTLYDPTGQRQLAQVRIDRNAGDYPLDGAPAAAGLDQHRLISDFNVCAVAPDVTVGTIEMRIVQDGVERPMEPPARYDHDQWGVCERDEYNPVRIPVLLHVGG